MNTATPGRPRLLRLAVTTAVLGLLATVAASPSGAVPAARRGGATPKPQLSISVTDARHSATTGDRLSYTITVHNLGTTKVTGLTVSHAVPAGLTFGSARPTGVLRAGRQQWPLQLATGGTATLHTTMTVSRTPAQLLRLAVVACVGRTVTGPPIVCAADSDQLPAGAAKQRRTTQASGAQRASADRTAGHTGWYVAGGSLVLAVALLALAMLRLRRRRDRALVSS